MDSRTDNAIQPSKYGTGLRLAIDPGWPIDDEKHEIPTESKDRLIDLIEDEAMPGGALGLAGPRGAGKSTLMRSLCSVPDRKDSVLGAMVDAPVDYDARDFVLHLFAKVCTEIIGRDRVVELRGFGEPVRRAPSPSRFSHFHSWAD